MTYQQGCLTRIIKLAEILKADNLPAHHRGLHEYLLKLWVERYEQAS